MKILMLSLFTAVVLISVYSCECYNTCGKLDDQTEVSLIGFSDTELTPLILKTYLKNSGFSQLVDSVSYDDFDNNTTTENWLIVNSVQLSTYVDSFDYTITLPTVGKNYAITNLTWQTEICKKCGQKTPVEVLKGYTLNGEVKTTDDFVEIRE